jgi:hypothetical protein
LAVVDMIVCGAFAVGAVSVRDAFAVSDVSFAAGYALTMRGAFTMASAILRSAFAGRGMTMGSEVAEGGVAIVADDAIVGGGMIVAVDCDGAQELANVIGTDCRAKHGSPPDNVVVDGQSYVPVLPPGS